jgi:transcriptional pleiotropic regulator of transition state genes
MKSTGIVRKMDGLGRVVLPMELRRTHGINENDPIEIFTEGKNIILRPYKRGCDVCGEVSGTGGIKDVSLCPTCIKVLAEASGVTK